VQFIRIKKRNRKRTDGRSWVKARVIPKTRNFGQVIEDQQISTVGIRRVVKAFGRFS
jgi:hypothetical protein